MNAACVLQFLALAVRPALVDRSGPSVATQETGSLDVFFERAAERIRTHAPMKGRVFLEPAGRKDEASVRARVERGVDYASARALRKSGG